MKMDPVIFREYDIRGVYNSHFDNDFATELGRALTYFIRQSTNIESPVVTVGYDARHSSPDLATAVGKGIVASGGKCIQLGLIATPISYFSTFTMDNVAGAIMVTGSHNPPEYNGFKISVGKTTLVGSEILELHKIIVDKLSQTSTDGGSESSFDIFPQYLERYFQEFKDLNPIPFVVDCGNGSAGCIVRKLYEGIGLKPEILFETPDGSFPNHHPDPTVETNLTSLKAAVVESNALIGIGFDGDADRIGVVDDQGNMVNGDELLALYSRFVLKNQPGATIVGDVKCSNRLFTDIKSSGGRPIMWKSGHSLVKKKMAEENAAFGGELSGHIFFRDRNFGYDDALYAGLRLVEIISQSGKTIKQLLSDFPSSVSTPEIRIDTTEEKKHLIVKALKDEFSVNTNSYEVNHLDGVRVNFAEGWALARISNTQPVLVLRFESNSQIGLESLRGKFEKIINPLL